MKISQSDKRRFWERVNKDGPIPAHVPHIGKCWLWTGQRGPHGYGSIYLDKATRRVHRVALEMAIGTFPEEKHVLHRCDNRLCVNFQHLFLGDNDLNVKDRVAKGRGSCGRGETHGLSKLTALAVMEIRSNQGHFSKDQMAKAYGVIPPTIFHAASGLTWKHIPMSATKEAFERLKKRMQGLGIEEGRKSPATHARVYKFADAPYRLRSLAPRRNAKWLAVVPRSIGKPDWIYTKEFGFFDGTGRKIVLSNGLDIYIGYHL